MYVFVCVLVRLCAWGGAGAGGSLSVLAFARVKEFARVSAPTWAPVCVRPCARARVCVLAGHTGTMPEELKSLMKHVWVGWEACMRVNVCAGVHASACACVHVCVHQLVGCGCDCVIV